MARYVRALTSTESRFLTRSSVCITGLAKKSATILFLGLDNAGKTTVVNALTPDFLIDPTIEIRSKEYLTVGKIDVNFLDLSDLTVGKIDVNFLDLSGDELTRQTRSDHFATAHAIVFLVDASDTERLDESKRELDKLLMISQLPVLVLANKCDLQGALTKSELENRWGLGVTSQTNPQRPIAVFACSATCELGYIEGLRWLIYCVL